MKTFPLILAAFLSALLPQAIGSDKTTSGPGGIGAEMVALYEEEVLAHDLYVAFGKQWPDVRPFQNIPRSEQMHREAMSGVLKNNRVPLPRSANGQKFATSGLNDLFSRLRDQGSKSEVDALRAGALIEETDIADLRAMQAGSNSDSDKAVFANLEAASGNHFRAFVRNLEARGVKYTPSVLSQSDANKILAAASSGGRRAGSR
ncbi:MAG: DUF2202 domain-containing protein [Terrimicrobiaceae bacterium]